MDDECVCLVCTQGPIVPGYYEYGGRVVQVTRAAGGVVIFYVEEDPSPYASGYTNFIRKARLWQRKTDTTTTSGVVTA